VAVTALRRHRREQVASLGGDRLVFARPDGRPVDSKADWQDWQNLLADLGLRHYRVHDLRHATATFLLEAGEDIRVVQAIMGHATPDFTRRAYQHVRPVMKRRAAETLDDYLRGEG
jgi:integrase